MWHFSLTILEFRFVFLESFKFVYIVFYDIIINLSATRFLLDTKMQMRRKYLAKCIHNFPNINWESSPYIFTVFWSFKRCLNLHLQQHQQQFDWTFFYLSDDSSKDKKLTIVETETKKLQTGPTKNLQTPHQSFCVFPLKFMTWGRWRPY